MRYYFTMTKEQLLEKYQGYKHDDVMQIELDRISREMARVYHVGYLQILTALERQDTQKAINYAQEYLEITKNRG